MLKWPLYQKMHHENYLSLDFQKRTKVRILIFAVETMAFLRDSLIESPMHNLVHKEPSPVKAEKYRLKMRILMMGKNDLEMISQMRYYVRLLLCFFRKNEKFPFPLLMERELFQGLLSQYL